MRLKILESTKEDLIAGYHFYEEQTTGLGTYFLDTLFSDIDSGNLRWHPSRICRFPPGAIEAVSVRDLLHSCPG